MHRQEKPILTPDDLRCQSERLCSRVALVGAPCSGKTFFREILETLFTITKENSFVFIAEAWHNYKRFAKELFALFEAGGGSFTNQTISELPEAMKNIVVWSIKTTACPLDIVEPKVIQLVVDPSGQMFYQLNMTLWNAYQRYGLRFLDRLADIGSLDELRRCMQEGLFRIQALAEIEIIVRHWYQKKIIISEGSLLNIVHYWPKMSPEDYQEIAEPYGLSVENLHSFYDAIILLESLTQLEPAAYEPYFWNGERLDSPTDSRALDERLKAALKDVLHCFIIPAAFSKDERLLWIIQILLSLRDAPSRAEWKVPELLRQAYFN